MVIRLAKAAIVAALAAFCAHGRFNVFDYDSNYQFVRHVLRMDTIFPDSTLRSRAIDSETMWRAAYALIIAAEALCGLLLALGAAECNDRCRTQWHGRIGFGLWFFGFIVIGGEYFAMWQSSTWNGQEGAFRFVTMILGGLVFLSLPDGELI